MKLVILCTPLEAGGAQRAAIRLAEEFRFAGFDSENWFLYKKRDIFTDVPYLKIMYPRNIRGIRQHIKAIVSLYRNLKKHRPDVLITFTHYSNIIGQFIALLIGIKVRIASHRNISHGDMGVVLRCLDWLNATFGVYTAITAVSESTKSSFSYYPERVYKKVRVIHNGMNFTPSALSKIEAKKFFRLPTDRIILGTIGRLSTQKNQVVIINAIRKLKDIHFVIVGEGELRHELEGIIESLQLGDRVHLLGEIDFRHIPDFLKAIDIFVMPSLFEGLSNALVEAMKAGLPIIVSDVESQRDVVSSEGNQDAAILLPHSDVESWTTSIEALCNSKSERQKFEKLSIDRGKEFTMEKMFKGFQRLI